MASQSQFTYLFCLDGAETVLDCADALSAFVDKSPRLISGEGIGEMLSGCQLIRWPSHVLGSSEKPTQFLGGRANSAAFVGCAGAGPVFKLVADGKSWALGLTVLHDDGAVDRVAVAGTFAPCRTEPVDAADAERFLLLAVSRYVLSSKPGYEVVREVRSGRFGETSLPFGEQRELLAQVGAAVAALVGAHGQVQVPGSPA